MNVAIGDIIIDKIKTLPFIDKYAGVVKTIRFKNAEGKEQRFPAACHATLAECESGKYKDLCPDSDKKSVLYLVDRGVRFIKREGSLIHWQGGLDLVCWLNLPKLGYDGCSYSAIAIAGIITKLPGTPFNVPNTFQRVQIIPSGENSKENDPFSKYTYDETVKQYLMYPFDYFVLQLETQFITDARCLTVATLDAAIACHT